MGHRYVCMQVMKGGQLPTSQLHYSYWGCMSRALQFLLYNYALYVCVCVFIVPKLLEICPANLYFSMVESHV